MRNERPKGKGRLVKLYVQAETPPSSQDSSSQEAELNALEAEHMALLKRAKIRNLQLANAALREGLARGGYVELGRGLAQGINAVPRVASPQSANDEDDDGVAPDTSGPLVEPANDREAARDDGGDEGSKEEASGNEEASHEDVGGAPLNNHLAPLNDHLAVVPVVASPLAASDTGTDEDETKQDDSEEDFAHDDIVTEQGVEVDDDGADNDAGDDAGDDGDDDEVALLGAGASHPVDSSRATSDQEADEDDKINQQEPDRDASSQGESDEDNRNSPERHRKRSPSPTSSSPRSKRPRSTPSSPDDDNQDVGSSHDESLNSDAEAAETSSGVDVASPELRRGLPLVDDDVRPNTNADDDEAPAPYGEEPHDEPDIFDFGGGEFDEAALNDDVDMIHNDEDEPRGMVVANEALATPATLRRLHEALRSLDARRDAHLASRPRRGRGIKMDISQHLIDVVVQRGSMMATDPVAADADMYELLDALALTPLDVAIARFMAIADVLQRRQWLRLAAFGEFFRTTVQNGTQYRGDRRAADVDTGPWVAHPLQHVWSHLPTAIFPWWTARVHPSDPEPQSIGPSHAFMVGNEQVVCFPVDGLTGRVIFNALARPSRSSDAETRATSVELFRLTPNDADADAILALAPYWLAAIQMERAAHRQDDPCRVVPLPEVFDVLEQAVETWVTNAQARRRPGAADLSIRDQLDLVQALVPSEPLDRLDLKYMGRSDGCSFVTRARSVRWLVFDVCAVLGCSASRLHQRRCTIHSRDNLTECVVDNCDELGYGGEGMCTRHRALPIPVEDDD